MNKNVLVFIGYLVLQCTAFAEDAQQQLREQETQEPFSYEDETQRDLTHWKRLLDEKNYGELERISDELRQHSSKYSNGRGKDWRFYWTPLKKRNEMTEEDYRLAIESVEGWLHKIPDSVSARVMLAHLYHQYGFFARGGQAASLTPDAQLQAFSKRNATAKKYLDEVAKEPESIDNVHRRLQIEISKGLGEKPDIQLVYETLDEDPLNTEIVHGMAICLLPRWYGELQELEKFAREVARRTKGHCGAFQYLIAVMAAKEFLKEYVLLEHSFDIDLIRQGVKDALRLYPQATEYHDEAAQLLYLAGDVEGAAQALENIQNRPSLNRWRYAEINYVDFKLRVRPELLEGTQVKLIAGSTTTILNLDIDEKQNVFATVDSQGGIRYYDLKTGDSRNWMYLQNVKPWTTSMRLRHGLLGGGAYDENMMYVLWSSSLHAAQTSIESVVATGLSYDGQLYALADARGIVDVYYFKRSRNLGRYTPPPPTYPRRHLVAIEFSPEDDELYVTTRDGHLLRIDLHQKDSEKQQELLSISPVGLRCLAVSQNFIAVGDWRGKVFVLDRATRKVIYEWTPKVEAQVRALDFSPDEKRLAIGRSFENQPNTKVPMPLSVWRFQSEDEPVELKGHQYGVLCAKFTDSGKRLISAGNDWTVRYWNVDGK